MLLANAADFISGTITANLVSYAFNFQVPETKIAEFANRVDLDEVAHNEPPHLDLHCLPSRL